MSWQFTSYVIPLTIGSAISGTLAYYAWRRHPAPGALPFTVLMLAVTEWSLTYALQLAGQDMPTKLFWAGMQYFGVTIAPAAWLVLIWQYGGYEKWLTRRRLLALTIQPFITWLLVWTNDAHHLIWYETSLDATGSFLAPVYGAWFWITVAYSYTLIAIGTLLLVWILIRSSRPYRLQATILLLGVLAPWLSNISYVTGLNPFPQLDMTTFAFTLTGIVWFWGLFRFGLMDIMPVAHATIIKSMLDGVIVLDLQERVIHLNPAAQRISGFSASAAIGQPITQILPATAALFEHDRRAAAMQAEMAIGAGELQRHFDWRLSTLQDRNGRPTGRLLTLRDITGRKRAEDSLRQRERHLTLLNEITRTAAGELDFQTMLQTVANRLGELIGADDSYITLWDETRQIAIPTAASGAFKDTYATIRPQPGEVTLTESVLRAGHTIAVADASNSPYISPRIVALFPQNRSLLGLPLIAGGQKLGAALIIFTQPHRFSPDEIGRAEQAAAQIALAIAKAQLLQTEREQRELAESLRAAGAALSATLDFNRILDRLLDQIAHVVPYDSGVVMLVEEGRARVISQRGYEIMGTDATEKVATLSFEIRHTANLRQLAETGQPLIIPDVTRYPGWVSFAATSHIRSWAGAPIMVQGEIIALFSVDKTEPNFYRAEHAARLAAFASQASLALHNARLYEETWRQLKELIVLNAVTTAGTEARNENELIERATRIIGERLYPNNFGVLLLDESAAILRPHYSYHTSQEIKHLPTITLDQGIAGQVAITGQPRRIDNATQDPAYLGVDPRTQSELCVPLKTGKQIIGVINAESVELNAFTASDERLLVTLAGQLATAIEKMRLFESGQLRRQEAETLRQATAALTSTLDLDQVLDGILTQLKQVVPYDSASVLLFQEDSLRLVAGHGFSDTTKREIIDQYFPADDPLTAAIRRAQQPICLADAQADTRFQKWGDTTYIRGWIGVPLIVRGEVIGVLTVDNRLVGAYGAAEAALTQAFANQAAVAIENARLFQEIHHRTAELQAVAAVSATLRAAHTVAEMLLIILKKAAEVASDALSSIFLIEPASGDLVARGSHPPDSSGSPGRRFRPGQGITGFVAATGQTHVTEDLAHDPRAHFLPEEVEPLSAIRASVSLPLRTQERIIGVMHVGLPRKHIFTEDEIRLLTAISEIAGSALDRAMVLETLEQRVADRTRELAKANEKLKELDRLKSKFVSDVAHELRTPVTNFSLYLDLLKRGDPEKQEKYVTVLRQQADRLIDLIENILNLSRLDLGKTRVEFTQVNLNALVEPIIAAHRPRAEAAGLTLIADLQEDLPPVHGERNQLAQVVTHLLANAINYTPDGRIQVSTRSDDEKGRVCLAVVDTGIGIEPDEHEHLFERFYRGERVGQSNIPGTGLGLAIVKEIVDLHKGKIEVESEVDIGATFKVWLPAAGNG